MSLCYVLHRWGDRGDSYEPANPRGGTLIFSYIRRLGSFFGFQNFEFQNVFGFSEKIIFFGV